MINFDTEVIIKKDDLYQEQFEFRLFDHPVMLKCIEYKLLERKTRKHKFRAVRYWSFYGRDNTLDKAPLTKEICLAARQKLVDMVLGIPIGDEDLDREKYSI